MATKDRTETDEAPAQDKLEGPCANCGDPAVVKVNDGTANPVQFCQKHKPDNVE